MYKKKTKKERLEWDEQKIPYIEFKSDYIVFDIATKCTGYLVYHNGEILESGSIDGGRDYSESWIPEGEGRTDKERYIKKRGILHKKADSKRRADKLHNRLIYKKRVVNYLIEEFQPRYLIKELTISCRDLRTALELGESHCLVTDYDIPIISYYPVQWRERTKKRNTLKEISNECLLHTFEKDSVDYKHYKRMTTSTSVSKIPFVNLYMNDFNKLPITNDESDSYAIHLHHHLDKSMFGYNQLSIYYDEWCKAYDYNRI